MGLLDDAIREHLDLKRRRGADPADIERAEREALGPVRREPIGSEESPEGLDPGSAGDLSVGEQAPARPDEPPAAGETYGDELHDAPAVDEDEAWDEYDDGEYEDDEEDFDPRHPDAGPDAGTRQADWTPTEADASRLPPDPDDELGDTASYELEPGERRGEGEEDDVLEETPEFLQDTPDHDRLWFEQRPPRDFDFDE